MSDNVIILGAGFSFDAGIPLLGGFVDRMWEYAARGRIEDKPIGHADLEVLKEALDVRRELDGYHGRATFDDRNIEDLLSILAFNVLGGGPTDKRKLEAFSRAISTTIELACSVKHPGLPKNGRYSTVKEGPQIYRNFWKYLFSWIKRGKEMPTIISFNYDLVLERALLQVLINTYYDNYDKRLPFDAIKVNYQYEFASDSTYKVKYTSFGYESPTSGTIIELVNEPTPRTAEIELLKLHGSLNFPKSKKDATDKPPTLVDVRDKPYILPPVSNKSSSGNGEAVWRTALNRLRKAKNVIFVGYSLPKTDMYMQFFLKAALGPNQDLNRVFVFDPILSRDGTQSAEMKSRFGDCFSAQFRNRIEFHPRSDFSFSRSADFHPGTADHFVNLLGLAPEAILF